MANSLRMKGLIYLTFFTISQVVMAQPFALNTSKWYYGVNGGFNPDATPHWRYEFTRDTVIFGDSALVFSASDSNVSAYGLGAQEWIFKLDDSLVYSPTNWGGWGLLYSFKANVGDTLIIPDFISQTKIENTFVVAKIDTVIIDRIALRNFQLYNTAVWGIAFHGGGHYERFGNDFFIPISGTWLEHQIIRCYEDDDFFVHLHSFWDCEEGSPIGLNIQSEDDVINIYPNPTSGRLFGFLKFGQATLILYDEFGKSILKTQLAGVEDVFDLPTNLKNGLYFMNVENKQGVFTTKISLERNS